MICIAGIDGFFKQVNPSFVRVLTIPKPTSWAGQADPALRVIPVVVLTTSKAEEDVLQAYGLHANCYVTKPVEFGSFSGVVQSIEKFWFTVVTLPEESP